MKITDEMLQRFMAEHYGSDIDDVRSTAVRLSIEAALAHVPEPDARLYDFIIANAEVGAMNVDLRYRVQELEARLLEKLQQDIDLETRISELEAKLAQVKELVCDVGQRDERIDALRLLLVGRCSVCGEPAACTMAGALHCLPCARSEGT